MSRAEGWSREPGDTPTPEKDRTMTKRADSWSGWRPPVERAQVEPSGPPAEPMVPAGLSPRMAGLARAFLSDAKPLFPEPPRRDVSPRASAWPLATLAEKEALMSTKKPTVEKLPWPKGGVPDVSPPAEVVEADNRRRAAAEPEAAEPGGAVIAKRGQQYPQFTHVQLSGSLDTELWRKLERMAAKDGDRAVFDVVREVLTEAVYRGRYWLGGDKGMPIMLKVPRDVWDRLCDVRPKGVTMHDLILGRIGRPVTAVIAGRPEADPADPLPAVTLLAAEHVALRDAWSTPGADPIPFAEWVVKRALRPDSPVQSVEVRRDGPHDVRLSFTPDEYWWLLAEFTAPREVVPIDEFGAFVKARALRPDPAPETVLKGGTGSVRVEMSFAMDLWQRMAAVTGEGQSVPDLIRESMADVCCGLEGMARAKLTIPEDHGIYLTLPEGLRRDLEAARPESVPAVEYIGQLLRAAVPASGDDVRRVLLTIPEAEYGAITAAWGEADNWGNLNTFIIKRALRVDNPKLLGTSIILNPSEVLREKLEANLPPDMDMADWVEDRLFVMPLGHNRATTWMRLPDRLRHDLERSRPKGMGIGAWMVELLEGADLTPVAEGWIRVSLDMPTGLLDALRGMLASSGDANVGVMVRRVMQTLVDGPEAALEAKLAEEQNDIAAYSVVVGPALHKALHKAAEARGCKVGSLMQRILTLMQRSGELADWALPEDAFVLRHRLSLMIDDALWVDLNAEVPSGGYVADLVLQKLRHSTVYTWKGTPAGKEREAARGVEETGAVPEFTGMAGPPNAVFLNPRNVAGTIRVLPAEHKPAEVMLRDLAIDLLRERGSNLSVYPEQLRRMVIAAIRQPRFWPEAAAVLQTGDEVLVECGGKGEEPNRQWHYVLSNDHAGREVEVKGPKGNAHGVSWVPYERIVLISFTRPAATKEG